MLKHIVIMLITLINVSAWADDTPYKGAGGQIEAYGSIVATYLSVQKAVEICEKYPSLKIESNIVKNEYVRKNEPLFKRVSERLKQLAQINGGEPESRRLKAEIDAATPYATQEVYKIATDVVTCNNILSNIKRNLWDIQFRHPKEIRAIMGLADQVGTSSFIKGIIDGCTDGQKSQYIKQGLSYQGNEETVRQYCYCMAPFIADISSTADSRIKLIDGDPKIKVRIQKLETICLDGIKNGRRFAPEK
jgi:hypothetical protein